MNIIGYKSKKEVISFYEVGYILPIKEILTTLTIQYKKEQIFDEINI